jgi:hypothetical protein
MVDWTPQSYPLRLGLLSYLAPIPQFPVLVPPPSSSSYLKVSNSKNCYSEWMIV